MKKIEMGKKYRTRDGRDVRILCVDSKGTLPVVGLVTERDNSGDFIECWRLDGTYFSVTDQYRRDLIEISPYADIPIDTPGWARAEFEWRPRYFAGVDVAGNPTTWADGMTSFSADGRKSTWFEFTTTKPEGV